MAQTRSLRAEIAAMERRLGMKATRREAAPKRAPRSEQEKLAMEIQALEKRLGCGPMGMGFNTPDLSMDFDEEAVGEEVFDDDVLAEEEALLEDEGDTIGLDIDMAYMDDDDEEILDEDFEYVDDSADLGMEEDEDSWMSDEMDDLYCSLVGSETESGAEDEIDQSSLEGMEELTGSQDAADEDSMIEVTPTDHVANLREASARLDVVASYFEKHKRPDLALKVDKIAEAVDARIARLAGEDEEDDEEDEEDED